MKRSAIREKSFDFALAIIKQVKETQLRHNEYILTKQLIRSGTSVGAMVVEAEHAESKKDFIHKMSIGLKEANESRYWLTLLYQSDYISKYVFHKMNDEVNQIIKLLAAIVKSSKNQIAE